MSVKNEIALVEYICHSLCRWSNCDGIRVEEQDRHCDCCRLEELIENLF